MGEPWMINWVHSTLFTQILSPLRVLKPLCYIEWVQACIQVKNNFWWGRWTYHCRQVWWWQLQPLQVQVGDGVVHQRSLWNYERYGVATTVHHERRSQEGLWATMQEGFYHHCHEFGGQQVDTHQGMQRTSGSVEDAMQHPRDQKHLVHKA